VQLSSLTQSRSVKLAKAKTSPTPVDENVVTITDKVKIAGAATAGGVTGLTRGIYKGSSSLTKQPVEGAKFGAKLLRPVGRLLGGAVAAVATTATALAAPIATVAAGSLGFVGGTVVGAAPLVKQGLSAGARGGVRAGATVGSAVLGAVGGIVGAAVGLLTLPTILYPPLGLRVVPLAVRAGAVGGFRAGTIGGRYAGMGLGAAAGGTLGGAAAIIAGTPKGLRTGATTAQQASRVFKAVPQVARKSWAVGMRGGDIAGNVVGGGIGGAVGVGTGLVTTALSGLADGTRTALRWGGNMIPEQKASSPHT
jgi:hypothetical protein